MLPTLSEVWFAPMVSSWKYSTFPTASNPPNRGRAAHRRATQSVRLGLRAPKAVSPKKVRRPPPSESKGTHQFLGR